KPYLLIGPGRWGSADPWLGIPVQWQDISGAGAIVELRNDMLKVDPSQGSHFFHNIISLGIPYVTVTEGKDGLDWKMLAAISPVHETAFLRHLRFAEPFIIKADASQAKCVMFL
ncbi:phosphoenolpyruvate synthase/pyruvate phosphate dikinase, partial [Candidatus Pacearchaeota archaeon]|nr:phosphoenolpyruvate synthase/pyruvate phosphate dikinase [Candidatus Pacearchaeota archaeon]